MKWNPEVSQIFICAVLSVVGWAVSRALARLDAHAEKIAGIELALARDYVQHGLISEIQREQRRMNRILAHIQVQLVALAGRLSVRVEPFDNHGEPERSEVQIDYRPINAASAKPRTNARRFIAELFDDLKEASRRAERAKHSAAGATHSQEGEDIRERET